MISMVNHSESIIEGEYRLEFVFFQASNLRKRIDVEMTTGDFRAEGVSSVQGLSRGFVQFRPDVILEK